MRSKFEIISIKATGHMEPGMEPSSGCITAMVCRLLIWIGVAQIEANGTKANGKWGRGMVTVFNIRAVKSTRANGLTIKRMDPDV